MEPVSWTASRERSREFVRLESAEENPQDITRTFSEKKSALQREVDEVDRQEDEIRKRLACVNQLRDLTAGPLELRLATLEKRQKKVQLRLYALRTYAEEDIDHPAPGPLALKWVESTWFHSLCTIVILVNMFTMLEMMNDPDSVFALYGQCIDMSFLSWYCFELLLRVAYHQRDFLIGRPSFVCWNYMDAIVVLTGAFELLPKSVTGGAPLTHVSALRILRIFRVLRVFRAVKAAKEFYGLLTTTDLTWIDGYIFQSFMGCVIGINVLTMWPELDYGWLGWTWVENVFLLIYVFEVGVKLKVYRLTFFISTSIGSSSETVSKWVVNGWNILDFVIVVAGSLDLWMLPLYSLAIFSLTGHEAVIHGREFIMLLRMLRILRIFRLARLIRSIDQLHLLVVGVGQSMAAMFWVAVLALIVIYTLGITLTECSRKNYFEGVQDPSEVERTFGNVPDSMFQLFKLMNDDLSAADLIASSPVGKLLFVFSMVVLNWAILATLTSVISGQMIGASQEVAEQREKEHADKAKQVYMQRLRKLFEQMDHDGSGVINEKEWQIMTTNPRMSVEFAAAAGVEHHELHNLFTALCDYNDGMRTDRHANAKLLLSYSQMIHSLADGNRPADQIHENLIMKSLGEMDLHIDARMKVMFDCIASAMSEPKAKVAAAEK